MPTAVNSWSIHLFLAL